MSDSDAQTVQRLRSDVAHQIARHIRRLGVSQLTCARQLSIPQPTLSKIVNGRVADLSLELLIRIAVRAGLALTLQIGAAPEESGAHSVGQGAKELQSVAVRGSDASRQILAEFAGHLTPAQRIEAFLEHSQLVAELHATGQRAERERTRRIPPARR